MSTPTKILKALGSKYRLQIIHSLKENGEMNVSELNKLVLVSQPALSQHLAKLRGAGILKFRREQRQIFYSIADKRIIRLLKILEG